MPHYSSSRTTPNRDSVSVPACDRSDTQQPLDQAQGDKHRPGRHVFTSIAGVVTPVLCQQGLISPGGMPRPGSISLAA